MSTTPDDDVKLVDSLVAKLSEHFEAVQIMVSRPYKKGTRCIKRGAGAHEFINDEQSESQAAALGPIINPPDEGEAWRAK